MTTSENKHKVLAVYGDALTSQFTGRILARAGYQVASLANVSEARRVLTSQASPLYSCLVIDLSASPAEGRELLDWVRQHDSSLSFVAVMGNADSNLLQNILRAGPCSILNKPLDRVPFEAAVAEAVELTRARRRAADMQRDVCQIGVAQRSLIQASTGTASSGVQIYHHPIYEAGGDFFSYYHLSPTRSAALITDVSGHDLKSAFVSAHFQGMVRVMLESGASLCAVCNRGNAFLLHEWREGAPDRVMSVSAASVVIDHDLRTVEVLRCGIPAPVFTSGAGECISLGVGSSYPLGWFDEYEPEQISMPLVDGHVTMWTDGVEELAAELSVSSCALASRLLNVQQSGAETALVKSATDDMLVARLKVSEKQQHAQATESTFQPVLNERYTRGELPLIDSLQQVWENSMRLVVPQLSGQVLHDVLLCIREGVLNALRHGCAEGGTATLRLTISEQLQRLILQIEDSGPGHDFDVVRHESVADDDLPLAHRGLILMQAFSQGFRSERRGARLTMEFALGEQSVADSN